MQKASVLKPDLFWYLKINQDLNKIKKSHALDVDK